MSINPINGMIYAGQVRDGRTYSTIDAECVGEYRYGDYGQMVKEAETDQTTTVAGKDDLVGENTVCAEAADETDCEDEPDVEHDELLEYVDDEGWDTDAYFSLALQRTPGGMLYLYFEGTGYFTSNRTLCEVFKFPDEDGYVFGDIFFNWLDTTDFDDNEERDYPYQGFIYDEDVIRNFVEQNSSVELYEELFGPVEE